MYFTFHFWIKFDLWKAACLRHVHCQLAFPWAVCHALATWPLSITLFSTLYSLSHVRIFQNVVQFSLPWSYLLFYVTFVVHKAFVSSGSSDYQNARIFFSEEKVGTRERRNQYELAPGLPSLLHADVHTCSVFYPWPLRVQWWMGREREAFLEWHNKK